MKREKTSFICEECEHEEPKWMGKCPSCHSWNTFIEGSRNSLKTKSNQKQSAKIHLLKDIDERASQRIDIDSNEIKRVLGGGVCEGSITLLGGEPGVGKSTLLVQICGKVAKINSSKKILYISGEESLGQVASRFKRLNVLDGSISIMNENSWQAVAECIDELNPYFIIIDSIQTIGSEELSGTAGSVSQIKEVTHELIKVSKRKNITCFIIGHVSKDGAIAGPKLLEHMVDVVLYFEGDKSKNSRTLRCIKNRFGKTSNVGLFEMNQHGLVEVTATMKKAFCDKYHPELFGRSLGCIIKGDRPFLIEIQVLVVSNKFGNAKRVTQGFDSARLSMLVAVIEKMLNIPLDSNDIYINILGDIKISSRENDLAVIAAILSSYYMKPIKSKSVFTGEVGLGGEIREVTMVSDRVQELCHLGYESIYLGQSNNEALDKLNIEHVVAFKKITELKSIFQ